MLLEENQDQTMQQIFVGLGYGEEGDDMGYADQVRLTRIGFLLKNFDSFSKEVE